MKIIDFESPTHLAPDQNFYDQFPFTEIPTSGLSSEDRNWIITKLSRYRSKKGISLSGLLALGRDFHDLTPDDQITRVNDAKSRLKEVMYHSSFSRKDLPMTVRTDAAVAIIKHLRHFPLIWSYVGTQWDPGIYNNSGNVLDASTAVLTDMTETYPNWGLRRPKMQNRMQAIGIVVDSAPTLLRWQLTTH